MALTDDADDRGLLQRLLNSVAIAYLIVTILTLAILATMDPILPFTFLHAIVSPSFWRFPGGEFMVFMGAGIGLHIVLYAFAYFKQGPNSRIIQAILAALLNAGFYSCVFVMLILSGLKH